MTMTAPAVDRTDPEWHAWRRQGIGGSDVAAICGLGRWGSPFSVYLEKRGEITEPDLGDDPNVDFGKRLEPIIPGWFHERTGLHLIGEQTWAVHPEHEHHRATIDAFVVESPTSGIDDALGVGEIKVTGDSPEEWETIPDQYAIQGQWQMHVTGHDHLWFPVVHVHRRRLEVYEMSRDDQIVAELVRLVDDFWRRVQEGDPPAIDSHPATTRALKDAYPQHVDEEVEISSDLFERWRIAKSRVDAAKTELEGVENELRSALGEAAVATVDGEPVATYRTQRSVRLDVPAIKKELPEVAERYGMESIARYLRPKARKGNK